MSDAADYLTDSMIESQAAHIRGECDRGCEWCQEDTVSRAQRKRQQRITEFAAFGIQVAKGGDGVLGSICLHATEAEKVLRMLRRLRKLEGR